MLWKTKSEHSEITSRPFLDGTSVSTTSRHLLVESKKRIKVTSTFRAIMMIIATWMRVGETLSKRMMKWLTHRFCKFIRGTSKNFQRPLWLIKLLFFNSSFCDSFYNCDHLPKMSASILRVNYSVTERQQWRARCQSREETSSSHVVFFLSLL